MITKGFDFARVSLVGILNADNLLFAPDFRAAERAFQLMTQVAGRAGRRDAAGEVVIQTTGPNTPSSGRSPRATTKRWRARSWPNAAPSPIRPTHG